MLQNVWLISSFDLSFARIINDGGHDAVLGHVVSVFLRLNDLIGQMRCWLIMVTNVIVCANIEPVLH